MSRTSRIIPFATIGLVGPVVLVVGMFLLSDASANKARVEAAVSQALGMEFTVVGPMGIALSAGLLVTLADVQVRNRGSDVVSARQARLGIKLLPLLTGDVRITSLALSHARISLERDREGRFNFGPQSPAPSSTHPTSPAVPGALPAMDWPRVSLSDATLVYADKRMAHNVEAIDCRVDMQGLRLAGGNHPASMKDVSFTAEVACGELRKGAGKLSDLKFAAAAKGGIVRLEPLTMRVFDTEGAGQLQADFSDAVPRYRLEAAFAQVPIQDAFDALALKQTAAGRVDFSATLSLQGKTEKELRQTLAGKALLRGRNLTLNGSDLDQAFSRFEASQSFSLVDAGAFFIVGPLGLALTKGHDFANIYRGAGGSSQIQSLVSDWTVERGVAQAQDVAMTTKANRIALKGRLDFVNERFDDVSMALVDAKGCAKVQQKIRGSFNQPEVEKPNLLVSLAGPALNLLKKGGELLVGKECEVFYAGSVAAPG
jgi:AsmA protein